MGSISNYTPDSSACVNQRLRSCRDRIPFQEIDILPCSFHALLRAGVLGLEYVPTFVADSLQPSAGRGPIHAARLLEQAVFILAVNLADAAGAEHAPAATGPIFRSNSTSGP